MVQKCSVGEGTLQIEVFLLLSSLQAFLVLQNKTKMESTALYDSFLYVCTVFPSSHSRVLGAVIFSKTEQD